MTRPLNVLRFPGIHTDTLGHYLSGLGLLAAVGQRWPDVRGCWRDRRFVLLHESLTEEKVRQYLLAEWQPTLYERWWDKAQSADTKAKGSAAVRRERNVRSVPEVRVLEAHIVGAGKNQFNPIFGDGGVMGQRKFAAAWAECLKKARPLIKQPKETKEPAKKPPKPSKSKAQVEAEGWLGAALAGADDVELPGISSAGAWFVFANKSFNTGQKWFRDGRLSPWSYLLAVEGAFLLVGDANRRLGAKARPYAVFPFVCDPAQPTTEGEVGMLKGEFWAPLWDNPATPVEVRHLLRRGLARVGRRSAHAPAEFAVAALGAGTDAGVSGFARFELRHTTTTDYCREAIPREHVKVGSEPTAARLATEIVDWLGALRRHNDNRERQFRGLCGPVEAAVIRLSEAVGSSEEPERWRHLMLELARQQARIDRNKAFREKLPPIPQLRPDWFDRAWPEGSFPDEIVVARSVASVGAGTPSPVIVNVFGVEPQGRNVFDFTSGERPSRVVWDDGQPVRVLGQLLRRRLIDAEPGKPLPVGGPCPASLDVVNRLLLGDLDTEMVVAWVPALALIDWDGVRANPPARGGRFAGELLLWGLFRPIFHEDPHRLFDWLPDDSRPALARRILHLILAGNVDEAIRAAKGYYRAAGRRVVDVPTGATNGDDLPTRLAAALLIPADDRDIRAGLTRWLYPEKLKTA
jgi:CRISPR-associated protein Csx17